MVEFRRRHRGRLPHGVQADAAGTARRRYFRDAWTVPRSSNCRLEHREESMAERRLSSPRAEMLTFGVIRRPDAEFGRTRILEAAVTDRETAMIGGSTIIAAEATWTA